jgi:hypothetical protein
MRCARWLAGLLLLSLLAPRLAMAAERQSVAVLEFRQDVSAFPDLGERLARRLSALTGLRVVGLTEARQKLGSEVDGVVARCLGNPRCVGAIGARLGVHEVILVGLSSLGDVIVQFSRVVTSSGLILSSVGHSAPETSTLDDAQLDGFLRRLLPSEVFVRYGLVRVKSNRAQAVVYLDGRAVGATPMKGPIRVEAPSTHDIRVSRPGYVDFSARLHVPPEASILVNAHLPPLPRRTTSIVRRWWFWTAIVAGAAVIAATAVGASVGLQRDSVPAIVRW